MRCAVLDAATDYGATVTILWAFEDARSSRTAVSAKPLPNRKVPKNRILQP